MTPKPPAPQSPADLAQALERVLPVGHSLVRTHSGTWYLKSWTSKLTPYGPKMTWFVVDSDESLAALLDRLGREGATNG